ncbi:MBL fold metallo-hydrolase [Pseudonocardia xinjiangensis]|uniref:MBL fold metallo-hydrolase n=1 Tax=Pseudonocardia xinjiangensis TaxID=75289 RepID=UPI003D8ADEC4
MKVHHLNCGTMRPFGGRLVSGTGPLLATAELVCHCLLIETDHGLVLVDSGLGTGDVTDPDASLSRGWQWRSRPVLDIAETALRQVEQLGYSASDVRHVVLTHLDLDHAGGLRDFPDAQVHVLRTELEAATAARTSAERMRYPRLHWSHVTRWAPHDPQGETWFGFEAVRELPGLPAEILLVPLIGHTVGHTGVAVRDGDRWLLHAGDAYLFHGEMRPEAPWCSPGLRFIQNRMETVRGLRIANQDRLRELVRYHGDEITVFSAHDPVELRTAQRGRVAGGLSAAAAGTSARRAGRPGRAAASPATPRPR